MISKRDNLLKKPWEQRRYENHRKKVLSAAPAIDNREPATRMHVLIKLKKDQKEKEKRAKIERDNFSLLRNLAFIMRTNRVDNFWSTPQPNFLNRVALFDNNSQKYKYEDEEAEAETMLPKIVGIKGKCVACTPQKARTLQIPEERVPWEPEKLPVSRKIRSQSVPTISKQPVAKIQAQERTKSCKPRLQTLPDKFAKSKEKIDFSCRQPLSPTSVIFQRGCLKLAVNFPTDTTVKLQEKNADKVLLGRECFCKNLTKV